MMLALYIGLGVFLWVAGGVLTVACRHKWLEPPKPSWERDREFAHYLLGGMLWPLYLPLLTMWAVGTGKVKLPKPSKRVKAQQSPVDILTKIIVAKIIKEPERIRFAPRGKYDSTYDQKYVWDNSDNTVSVSYTFRLTRGDYLIISEVKVRDKVVETNETLIAKALRDAYDFNKKKKEADAIAAKELAALEAVESLLLTPEKEGD